ncbi:MAG: phosphoribosyltransferase family protein [Armatimonadota bacterium]|nr:phosphoribosyltransferase family protein [Armatimonadota bacterium]MDR7551136.1 phosphoribosyltransferase family protein [Armatimonadota bacterium]
MVFRDRRDAGRQLAAALAHLRDRRPYVLAVPRGGVVIGREVADSLGAPIDVIVPRKLRAPFNPELAIGAVAEGGAVFVDEEIAHGVPQAYLDQEIQAQRAEIARRIQVYRDGRPLPSMAGYTAIVTDDGIATGATMVAALRAARALEPSHLVVAVPVAPPEGVGRLAREADEVVCLATPSLFHAVGQFYEDFRQIEDDEVTGLLAARSRSGEG